jgi:transcriptional accessory protein Tex/SPT6
MNNNPNKPINRQAALFLSRKRHTNTVEEAIDGAMNYLVNGTFKDALAEIFSTEAFGPEPVVSFKMRIRKDVASPGKFYYTASTSVSHHIGDEIKFAGLNP